MHVFVGWPPFICALLIHVPMIRLVLPLAERLGSDESWSICVLTPAPVHAMPAVPT